MIVGDPAIFAIESKITEAYEPLGSLAIGYFVIHVGGRPYGVCEPDATLLACSFGEVENRISRRGRHTAPFATEVDAGKIADAFRDAIYSEAEGKRFFGIPLDEFAALFFPESSDLMWAPDGDEAFDDGSYILQFDHLDRVRLIAFQSREDCRHDPNTLRDVWLAEYDFYQVLQTWCDAFLAEWHAIPKVPVSGADAPGVVW